MNAVRRRRAWLAAGAAAALVLGAASTAALAVGSSGPAPLQRVASVQGCRSPALAGSVVEVDLSDMGAMMGGPYGPGSGLAEPQWRRYMPMPGMHLTSDRAQVRQGTVSIRAHNTGAWPHEVIVLPLHAGQGLGQRAIGSDGKVDETGSLGEASRSCAAGSGHPMGIEPGATGWTTMKLIPGRYELICNLPGHYAAGMFAELDVIR